MASSAGLRTLAGRYARALADAAPKEMSAALAALDSWAETVRHSPELPRVLADPRIPRAQRADLAKDLFSQLSAPPALVSLVALLVLKNRFGLIAPLREKFQQVREQREGVCRAVLETAAPLPEPLRERIRSRLAEILRLHVTLEPRVRPQILGGVNLRIGSRVWYGSVRHRLEQVLR